MLCGSSVTLNPAEAYVLGCAFILHDAAMGAASYQESIPAALGMAKWHDLLSSFIVAKTGNWPTAEELASPDEEIAKACTVHAIRELHAAHAEKLVDQSWTTSAGNDLYLIEDLRLHEWCGPLIRHDINPPPWQPEEWSVRSTAVAHPRSCSRCGVPKATHENTGASRNTSAGRG
jgi:hypothetical protein